ncbi:hypothetical protein NB723_001754 [Xanthomonas sacchari]|nr:hypothetical protein [Xanthomonas sacchari]
MPRRWSRCRLRSSPPACARRRPIWRRCARPTCSIPIVSSACWPRTPMGVSSASSHCASRVPAMPTTWPRAGASSAPTSTRARRAVGSAARCSGHLCGRAQRRAGADRRQHRRRQCARAGVLRGHRLSHLPHPAGPGLQGLPARRASRAGRRRLSGTAPPVLARRAGRFNPDRRPSTWPGARVRRRAGTARSVASPARCRGGSPLARPSRRARPHS